MSGTTVVMVLDRDDPKRGEIIMLPTTGEAARVAEDLIESGVEIERIRVFDATELSMKVEHKPVVSLGADDFPSLEPEPFQEGEPVSVDEAEPVPAIVSDSQHDADGDEPLVQNGVRFSSLFKPDDL